ncbi:MAG: ATP-binding protein [Bdellovibrionota bacterium]
MASQFPWRAFLHFFLVLVIVFGLWVLSVPLALYSTNSTGEAIAWSFAGVILLSLGVSWYLSRPIHKLLKITRTLLVKKDSSSNEPPSDVFEEELGEYSDLERLIKKLARRYRKKKEQLQREREENEIVMASVQEGLLSVAKNGDVLFFNSKFATSFMDPHSINKEGLKLTDVIRNPIYYQAFREVRDQGNPKRLTLQLNTKLDQQAHHYSVSLAPLLKKNQEVYGVMSVFYDISDIKRAEQMRVDFVGNASHELRTPLTSIKGYLATLQEDYSNNRQEQIPKFLDIISRNVERLIDLVSDLLTLSTLDSQPDLKIEQFDPQKLTESVIHDLSLMAKQKNITIQLENRVTMFSGDYGKVEQVLKNLISNAIKYIPEGKLIRVIWEQDEKNVVLRVIDNGTGISEEHLGRLFERFYRVDKGRAREHGGTGLGLSIVKHIVQSHGGEISVRSQLGAGAEFICVFPLTQ